jgi:hypothetical protein
MEFSEKPVVESGEQAGDRGGGVDYEYTRG